MTPSIETNRQRYGPVAVVAVLVLGGLAVGFTGTSPIGIAAAAEHTPPTASLEVAPNPAHPGETVVVDATESTDPDGTEVTCAFDLDGDGEVDAEGSTCVVETRYRVPGEVPITVRVVDGSGRSDEATVALRVIENEAPTARFDSDPAAPDPREPIRLDASGSSDPDGSVAAYRWDLDGDGNLDRVEGPTTTAVFEAAGRYAVTLTVVDDDGATDTATWELRVAPNVAPTAELAASPGRAGVGEEITFRAGGSSDPDGRIVEWAFDLDADGVFEHTPDRGVARASYGTAGEYAVAVRVTDDDGAAATATVGVVVAGETPMVRTVVRTVVVTPAPARRGLGGMLAGPASALPAIDGAWSVLLALVGVLLAATLAVGVRRRSAVSERARSLARRVRARVTPRAIARRVVRSGVKRAFRKAGEVIERGGERTGQGIRRIGDAVERVTTRIGSALKRWGA